MTPLAPATRSNCKADTAEHCLLKARTKFPAPRPRFEAMLPPRVAVSCWQQSNTLLNSLTCSKLHSSL
eukprot:scaffold1223_cov380-Prasinococcus_capsulatus_cf.AAC.8